MKIGQFVKLYIKKVFAYCESEDHDELERLMDRSSSKITFDINWPFCTEVDNIESHESKRYWTNIYIVRGKKVRVTSQWFDSHVSKSRDLFIQYILANNIASEGELSEIEKKAPKVLTPRSTPLNRPIVNSRYRGNAIGNAQNLLVRNILSNLGEDTFSENDWYKTKEFFSNRCAYCGEDDKLIMEHAIPINKKKLGEHRLGNIVPSCKECNSKKHDQDYREFLELKCDGNHDFPEKWFY